MNAEPDVGKDEEDLEVDSRAASMRDRLTKEVASWIEQRRQQSGETVIAPFQPRQKRQQAFRSKDASVRR